MFLGMSAFFANQNLPFYNSNLGDWQSTNHFFLLPIHIISQQDNIPQSTNNITHLKMAKQYYKINMLITMQIEDNKILIII